MIITRDIATKVLETVDAGLCSGKGQPIPGQMCVEAAVCYAMGLPHGDEPSCVSPAIRAFKIRLNDSLWSTNQARASGMRRLALVQLGSAGVVDDKEFAARLGDLAVRKIAPFALREAARVHPDQVQKAAVEQAAKDCEDKGTIEAAYAAYAAAYAANAANAANAARDKFLALVAEEVVQILKSMNAPGAQWLVLAPTLEATGDTP